jgi:hypothetical protein
MADRRSAGYGYLGTKLVPYSILHWQQGGNGGGGRGEREEDGPRDSIIYRKGTCRIKNGKGEKASQFSWSEIYEKARGKTRKRKEQRRLEIVTATARSKEPWTGSPR